MKIVSDCFNFVTTMLSYHIKFKNYVYLTGTAPKFRFWGIFSKNVLIKDFLKFRKFSKKFAQNFKKFFQNFSKIKFNRI